MLRNPTIGVIGAVLCLALGAMPAWAQEEQEGPGIRPFELYACNYHEGKSMDDLKQATASWNAWMDEQGQQDYFASILIPHYYSKDIDFDIGWAGLWPSGAAMAAGTEFWMTQGGDYRKGFEEVVDCQQHAGFALMTVKQSANVVQAGPVVFSNCTVAEGREFPEVMEAVNQWTAHETEQGIDASHFLAFPVYGESSDSDYNFKWITASSYGDMGKAWDDMAGGSWEKSMALFGGLLDCDSGRVYHGLPVRMPQSTE